MLLIHHTVHTDTLNTYLVDANLRSKHTNVFKLDVLFKDVCMLARIYLACPVTSVECEKRPPWKKSGWAWPTLEILAVV